MGTIERHAVIMGMMCEIARLQGKHEAWREILACRSLPPSPPPSPDLPLDPAPTPDPAPLSFDGAPVHHH